MKSAFKYILAIAICAVAAVSCNKSSGSFPSNKREVMDQFVAGKLDPSYVPSAFFIHFGAGKTVGEAAVRAQLEYLVATDMDILKVQFEQYVPRIRDLDTDEGWENFRPIPEDYYRPTFEIIQRLQEVAGRNIYVLPTIYSTYQVATQGLGRNIIPGFQNHPEALKKILDNYTDALLWLIKECKKIGIEGFYLPTQGGEDQLNQYEGFFENFVMPYDLKVMGEANEGTKMNILHICDWTGTYESLSRFKDYPGQIVNTPIVVDGKPFTLEDGYKLFKRPVLGGLDRQKEIIHSSEDEIAKLVDQVLAEAPKGKVMLGAECTVSDAPLGNLQTAVYTAHHQ